ncbi:ROK family protein [Lacticaseibacillus zhaodongensis]|uniref:ROK family protein n=1 Tax=Lacticaseibacillus zhaodongensis TaxID=2668065 RepID=UPI0018AFC495|nr:ROK family protein [Lacticaseibacillus zhaodongensis]
MSEYVAFDIGGTSIKYALVDDQGNISGRGHFATPTARDEIIGKMCAAVSAYQAEHKIVGVGVSAPGIVRRDGYLVTGGALMEFYEFDLRGTLAAKTDLPVVVENDANAAALAERWQGSSQGIDDYVCIVLGTGIGGGIVINGKPYRGAHGMAGELGWMVTRDDDATGDLEDASLTFSASVVMGLLRRYNAAHKRVDPDAEEVTDARVVLERSAAGDYTAYTEYHRFLHDISIMCINLFATLDPDRILIGGGISANPQFMADLAATMDRLLTQHGSLNRIRDKALGKVMAAGLRNDAGLLGAVYPLLQ